jgi:hypothetical protein
MKNENEAYEAMLCSHLEGMVYRLRQMTPEQFDYTFAPPAPSPRTLAIHAWQWLVCDRNHIAEPDASKHPRVPDPPADQKALCDALAEETENWRHLIRSLTPEKMLEERRQFNQEYDRPLNIRWFIFHMIQNAVYKHGQMSTTYFALGLDGTEPYTAPFPNPIYEELFGPRPVA